jgi:chromosome segregation ATPase
MAFYNNRSLVLDRGLKRRTHRSFGTLGLRLAGALRWKGADEDEPETVDEELLPRFPLVRHGYERIAVDGYVAELEQELAALDRELAELRGGGAPAAEVANEIKRIGEQTSAVLMAAHEQREEILRRARAEADRCVEEATARAHALTTQCEQRLRELEAKNETARGERNRLLGDLRTISSALTAVADSADQRIPPEPERSEPTST